MAVIDYGAIGFKNGKLISTGMFTPMEITCGFSDKDACLPKMDTTFANNYFLTIGNEDILIGFYKEQIQWWVSHTSSGKEDPELDYEVGSTYFNCTPYSGWRSYDDFLLCKSCGADIHIKKRNGYYVAYIYIKKNYEMVDTYKVYFGCGVDYDFYMKTGRVNYFRSPEYLFKKLKSKLRIRK